MLIEDFEDYYKEFANYTGKKLGMDYPKLCFIDTEWWYDYPIQDFDYQFNSWGFRGPEYTQYIGKPVNICLGDSALLNIGGPIEHSWPSLLAQYFDIPTLNFGILGAGNDAIKIIYDRACEIFDVQNTFVMYSYMHRRLDKNKIFTQDYFEFESNIQYFKENMIKNVIYTFIQPWCWSKEELDYLQNKHKNNLYNLLDSKSLSYTQLSEKMYNVYKGDQWVSYDEFTKGITNKVMQNDEIFISKIKEHFAHANRDGFHFNKIANQIVADFLRNQYNGNL
jgi:hypothetical protein